MDLPVAIGQYMVADADNLTTHKPKSISMESSSHLRCRSQT